MSPPTFGYWDIRGLAQPIRYLLAYAGVDHKDYLYDITNQEKWTQDKFTLGLDFPNLPYWIEGDIKLTESRAILHYLAESKCPKLVPDTPEMKRKCDMLENYLWDLWQLLIKVVYNYTDELIQSFKDTAPGKLELVSKFMGSNKFSLRNEMTYVDFIMYEVFYGYVKYDSNVLSKYPNLVAFMKHFEELSPIAEYMKSSTHLKGPCFSPSAKHQI